MVVAIDGPAGVGKSSVAARVARETGFLYLNSGDFYRSVTKTCLDRSIDPQDEPGIVEAAESCRFELRDGELLVQGRPVDSHIHSDRVDRWVSRHASIPRVRRIVNRRLREIAGLRDIIVEGRDIGTEVFPDAEVKIYLDARLEVRARRRFEQGTSRLAPEEIRSRLEVRDRSDSSRPVGSLRRSPDAVYLDTSDLTIDEVCERVIQEIHRKKKTGEEYGQ